MKTYLLTGVTALSIALMATISAAQPTQAMDGMHHGDKAMEKSMHKDDMMNKGDMMHNMAEAKTYTKDAFDAALADGKMIVVDVFKKGCPTCALQEPAINEAKSIYPDAVFFRVDFKNAPEAVKRFNAVKQSTIIVFKDGEEQARALGETDREKLLALIAKGA